VKFIRLNLKKIIKNILLILAGIILILFILEMILRIYGFFYEKIDKRIFKNKNNYTILCIGDSYTYGVGAPEKKDFPSQLEIMLNSNLQKKFKVINRGVPGQNSTEALQNLKEQIKIYKPDLIILNIGDGNFTNYYGYGTQLNKFLYRFRTYKLLSYFYLNYKRKKIDSELEKFQWETDVLNNKKGKIQGVLRIENVKSEIYKKAFTQVKKIINKEIKLSDDYYKAGTFYLRKNDRSEALKWYDEGISKYPGNYYIYEGLTYLYYFQNKYDKARKYMNICLRLMNKTGMEDFRKGNDLNFELRDKLDTSDIENTKLLYFLNSRWDNYYFSNTYYLTFEKLNSKNSVLIKEWLASDLQKIIDLSK
jgi:tetratricopeptide (TPR) repeat protein